MISQQEFTSRMSALMAECKASEMNVDEFLKKKLGESCKDGAQCAEQALRTLAEIDANYESLKQARSEGMNRQEWLRDSIEKSISDAKADKKRGVVGDVLARLVAVIQGKKAGRVVSRSFEGLDAGDTIKEIDDSLAQSMLCSIVKEQEEMQ